MNEDKKQNTINFQDLKVLVWDFYKIYKFQYGYLLMFLITDVSTAYKFYQNYLNTHVKLIEQHRIKHTLKRESVIHIVNEYPNVIFDFLKNNIRVKTLLGQYWFSFLHPKKYPECIHLEKKTPSHTIPKLKINQNCFETFSVPRPIYNKNHGEKKENTHIIE
jgi:hypothetical protein